MKKKSFNKKLTLNKKTIVDLENTEMGDAKGGVNSMDTYCETRCPTCPFMSCFIWC